MSFTKPKAKQDNKDKQHYITIKEPLNGNNYDFKDSYREKDEETELLTQNYDEYKVNTGDIKFFSDISKMREEKINYIKEQITYVDKLSNDAFTLTKTSNEKINTLYDNIDNTVHIQKEAHEIIKKTVFEHEKHKDNKCCFLLLIVIVILFLSLFAFGGKSN